MRKLIPLLLLSLFHIAVYGQVVVLSGWNSTNVSGFGPSPWPPTTINSNVTVIGLTRGAGVTISGQAAANAWGGNGWNVASEAAAITANKFVTFSITPKPGANISFSSLNLSYRRSGSGPSMGSLQYAIGNGTYTTVATLSFGSDASTGSTITPVNLNSIAALQNVPASTQVRFRIVPYGATGPAGTWYVFVSGSGLVINGTVSATPPPACAPPANLAVTNVEDTAVDISWDVVTGATEYEIDMTETAAPPASGLAVPSNAYTIIDLVQATTYYLHVRTNCGTEFSPWVTIPFTTLMWPLPLDLISFTGKPEATGVELNWTTANEQNISGFKIDRSENGTDFRQIAELDASGGIAEFKYSYTDHDSYSAGNKSLYYRLRIQGHDGRQEVSNTIRITTNDAVINNNYTIYPNPVTGDELFFSATIPQSQHITVKITDVTGQVKMETTLNANESNTNSINIRSLPKGLYLIQLFNNTNNTIQTLKCCRL